MSTITLHNLTKTYPGSQHASVADVSLAVATGELVALLGPSGCGKTTTLKMIAGLIAPDTGDIQFDTASVVAVAPERRRVAMVFQRPLLFPAMTVGENVAFGLRMRRTAPHIIRQRVAEMLELVHLTGYEHRRSAQLSGGQEQRVALARALITEPRVLLLDEPLSQLDAALRIEMRELIRQVQRQLQMTTIFVTHDQEEAVVLADRIALMFDGQIRQYDQPRCFYERPVDLQTARFFGGQNFIAGTASSNCFTATIAGQAITFTLGDEYGQIADRAATQDLASLLSIRPEAIVIGNTGPNVVRGTIVNTQYLGTQMRYCVQIGTQQLYVAAEPTSMFKVGNTIDLSLPAERLWVLPAGSIA